MDRGSPPAVLWSTPERSRIDEKDIGTGCVPIHLVNEGLSEDVSGLMGRLDLLDAEPSSGALFMQPLDRYSMSTLEMPHGRILAR
eukprot:5274351-Alexandrium_andersonii.AAC.1